MLIVLFCHKLINKEIGGYSTQRSSAEGKMTVKVIKWC